MSILITGGDGMVATELKKVLPEAVYLSHSDCDITDLGSVIDTIGDHTPELVVHLAALTDVLLGDKQKDYFYQVNVKGTANVAYACSMFACGLMYWSTEYIFDGVKGNYTEYDTPNPVNFYGLSKLLGEYEARRAYKSVVVRTALKPRPYKHLQVPKGVYTTGGYVDDMAVEFALAIKNFKHLPPTINIGIEKKLLTDLAKETREIEEIELSSLPVRLPADGSLELSNWKRIKRRISGNSSPKAIVKRKN